MLEEYEQKYSDESANKNILASSFLTPVTNSKWQDNFAHFYATNSNREE